MSYLNVIISRAKVVIYNVFVNVIILIFVFSSKINKVNSYNDKKICYIFISYSIGDNNLKNYYKESLKYGAKLVMKGLYNNSFIETKKYSERLKISYDINPILFEKYGIKEVPVIIMIKNNYIYKIKGNISLVEAFKIFQSKGPK